MIVRPFFILLFFIRSSGVPNHRQLQVTMSLLNFSASPACSAAAIPYPTLFGAEFLSIEANLVQNYSQFVHSGYYSNHGSANVTNVSFCNVTMSYTHPGQHDTVFVKVYLPIDTWNGRFQMVGGGSWQAGLYLPPIMGMTAAVGQGYSAISTGAGLGSQIYPTEWALLSPGNANLYLLKNLASVSLNDTSVNGKAVTTNFYGAAPKYSYFTGCSQGGRQGLMLAQRYPDAFDGIALSAPAINWSEFFMGDTWPSFFMNSLGEYPPSCEISAIEDALLDTCDGLDGLVDSIISDPNKCLFDPMSVVGQTFNCFNFGIEREVSSAAATIVQATFSGAKKTDNSSLWFGPNKGVVLSGTTTDPSMFPTTCSTNGACTAGNFDFASDWLKYFILKNDGFDFSRMTHTEFEKAFHMGVQQYTSIIGTSDPDCRSIKHMVARFLGIMGWPTVSSPLTAPFTTTTPSQP